MYAPYQVDWNHRGYFTPSLHGAELPEDPGLHPEWRSLQAHFTKLRQGEFQDQGQLVALARDASCGMMRQCFLMLLCDAGTRQTLRALADDALDSWDGVYPQDVAMTLAKTGVLRLVPDVLELFARRCDGGNFSSVLPLKLSRALEPEWGPLSDWDKADDDGELYCAKVEAFMPGFIERVGPDATVLYGQEFGVRYLAERFLELLGDFERRGDWLHLRQMFEGSTGIDMSAGYVQRESRPLKLAAILEDFLESPEAARYEHGARYFWGHRIPD